MKIDRDLNSLFESLNKLCSFVWNKKSCHIFDTDGICTHIFDTFCKICPVIKCVSITKCVSHCNLCMCFLLVCCFYSCLKVTKVIHTVKDTDDIDTVSCGFLYKILYYIICIWTISKNVLSTEQHLKLCVFETVTKFTKSFPRILFQET